MVTTAGAASGPVETSAGFRDLRRALVRNGVVALVLLVGVAAGTVLWAWHLAREEALRDAAHLGETTARGVISAFATPELLAGDPGAQAALDHVVRPQIAHGDILLAKIWRRDGTVAYSNRPALVGRRFALDADVVEAFGGGATAEVSSMDKAENALDEKMGPQVEVYAPFSAADGEPLLYEVYMPLSRLPQVQQAITREVVPLALTVLLLLQLLQVPLWISLVRSIRGAEGAHRRMLERSAAASETERRRLARFLHDDVVQNLAGAAYALDMIPSVLPPQTTPAVRAALRSTGQALVTNLGTLRGLIADLYPARLDEVGLQAALEGLLRPLKTRGVEATLDIDGAVEPPAAVATVTYSVAREAIRNADRHSGATAVRVRLVEDGPLLRLTVHDDGRGFDVGALAPELVVQPPGGSGSPGSNGAGASRATSARAGVNGAGGDRAGANGARTDGAADGARGSWQEGHYGLRLMHDTVNDAGGRLTVMTRPGAGTAVQAELPYR